jgi:hypothetical protein
MVPLPQEVYVTRYRKKPVEVEAKQFTDNASVGEILRWAGTPPVQANIDPATGIATALLIETLEGTMLASPGDYIIKGVDGEFYPCKPSIFERTYEPVVQAPDRSTVYAEGDAL